MPFQDLVTGLKMFQQGVQDYATNSAINDAQAQVKQLNDMQVGEMQKREMADQMAKQLSMKLIQTGAPADKVAMAFQAVAPEPIKSGDQMIGIGIQKGDEAMVKGGQTWVKSTPEYQLAKAKADEAFAARMAAIGARKDAQGEKQNKVYLDQLNKFNQNKDIGAMKQSLQDAQSVIDLLAPDQTGRIDAGQAGGAQLALTKAMSNLNRLNIQEIQASGLNRSTMENVNRALTRASAGAATQGDLAIMREVAAKLVKAKKMHLSNLARGSAKAISLADPQIDEKRMGAALTAGLTEIPDAPQAGAPAPVGQSGATADLPKVLTPDQIRQKYGAN